MARLTKCIKCGYEVSSEAGKCPRCGAYPHAQQPSTWYQAPRPASYEADRYQCTVCRTEYLPDNFPFRIASGMEVGTERIDERQECKKCGHPFRASKCAYCSRGIFEGTGTSVLEGNTYVHYHRSCLPLADVPVERKEGCAASVVVMFVLALLLCWR
jgi:predicted Zn-ribbon and HTH transcriptional regulator